MSIIRKLFITCFLIVLSFQLNAQSGLSKDQDLEGLSKDQDLEPITVELTELLDKNPDLKEHLIQSLTQAARINPDLYTNPAQTLPEYLEFVDSAAKLLPQQVLNNPSDLIRDQILQSICYFYFLVDQPLSNLPRTPGMYKNAIQYEPRFSKWLWKFAVAWGDYLNTPESFTDATYATFLSDPNFRLGTGDYEPRANWNTFNRFFSRYLSSPSRRPIAGVNDTSIVVSPADSQPQGVWAIDAVSNIVVNEGAGFRVKNNRYYSVNSLLGPNSQAYKNAFANGVLTHTFLNVFDYHRYHFPVGGTVLAIDNVTQNVALEVSWNTQTNRYDPIDSTGWQFTQTRGVVIVQTEKFGIVALIPMGMAHVSSVNFEKNVVVGHKLDKGDMLGTFLFGGSDYIMLFQERANFEIQAPIESAQTTYRHILMGERYGRIHSP